MYQKYISGIYVRYMLPIPGIRATVTTSMITKYNILYRVVLQATRRRDRRMAWFLDIITSFIRWTTVCCNKCKTETAIRWLRRRRCRNRNRPSLITRPCLSPACSRCSWPWPDSWASRWCSSAPSCSYRYCRYTPSPPRRRWNELPRSWPRSPSSSPSPSTAKTAARG